MRVLMLVSEAPPIKSGIARVAGELTERLRARGIEVDIISANEIPRWTFKEFRLSSLALHWREIQRILPRYDILHVHGTVPTFSDMGLLFGRLGLKLSRPRAALVYTHHSDIDIARLEVPVSVYNRAHRALLRLADHLVASTPTYAAMLQAHSRPGRVSVVRFGVDSDRFRSSTHKPERFNVLFVGQLRPYKGVDTLLRAWQRVDNADLHIVGEGHQREELEVLAETLDLQSVHFHGSASEKELKEFYASAHALVLPSNRKAEAFGLVLLEGMAAGCVPISSDLPGVADVVGTTGYTFPVGDHEALADILIHLRDSPELRRDMGVLATARSVAASWDHTAELYHGVFKQAYLGRQLERLMARGGARGALEKWLRSVARLAEADRISLMLVEPGTRTLRMAAAVGIEAGVVSTARLQLGERVAGFVAQMGRPMLVRRRGMHQLARIYLRNKSTLTSSLILPVHYRDERVGVINVARGEDRLSFTEADEIWLSKLAVQIAPVLSRYRAEANGAQVRTWARWLPASSHRTLPVPGAPARVPANPPELRPARPATHADGAAPSIPAARVPSAPAVQSREVLPVSAGVANGAEPGGDHQGQEPASHDTFDHL